MQEHSVAELAGSIKAGDVARVRELLTDDPALASVVDPSNGRSMLHHATDWPGHFPNVGVVIELLIASGADPDVTFPHPTNPAVAERPIHWAASSDDTEALAALAAGGAEVDAPGGIFDGCHPFVEAVIFEKYAAASMLLDLGAEPWLPGMAALGRIDDVRVMLADDPSQEVVDRSFQFACRAGHRDVAEVLLRSGADVEATTPPGRTAREEAESNDQFHVVEWLDSLT